MLTQASPVTDGGREVLPTPRLHYFALGATLYVPATHHGLEAVLNRNKLAQVRSLVVCTEDAVHERELPAALANLERALARLQPGPLLRFVRPRNAAVLDRLLRMSGSDRIDGLVLPKADHRTLPAFAEAAARVPHLCLMPTIETAAAFDRRALARLRKALAEVENPLLCLRIGGNDLLHLLGLSRPKHLTLYDTPLRAVLNDIILTFRPAGFELAAPVFEHLDCPQTLAREVELDIAHGLFTKTAIHPAQIGVIEAAYRVGRQEREMAERILVPDAPAVFRHNGQMCEPATHREWALRLMLRARFYGSRPEAFDAPAQSLDPAAQRVEAVKNGVESLLGTTTAVRQPAYSRGQRRCR